jgi:succinate dehydrogenase/fumarate reductase flavoprotein subunit
MPEKASPGDSGRLRHYFMRTLEADFSIIGSGVAGLRAALALAQGGREVLLVSKDPGRR